MRWPAVGLAVLTLGVTSASVAGSVAEPGPLLYVTNQDDGTVSVIDQGTHVVKATVDFKALGYGANPRPHHAQVEPDGSHWYVTLIGAGRVLKLDRANRVVGAVESEVPGLLALHPDRDLLVFARSMSAVNPPTRIGLIRRSDMTLLEEYDVFFPRPHGIALDARGGHVFVASLGANQLASVGLDDGHVELVDVEGPSHALTQLAVSPDGKWLTATGSTSRSVLVFDVSDPARPKLARTLATDRGPFEAMFTYDGRWLFISNLDANTVGVFETAGWTAVATIGGEGFSQPHGVALSTDGRFVFVSNRHQAGGAHDHEGHQAKGTGTLVAICIPTRAVSTVVPVGRYAAGIGVPVPARLPASPMSCR